MKKEDTPKVELKLDITKLNEIKPSSITLPKAPPINSGKKKDEESTKGLIEYSMKSEFNQSTYWGRFFSMFTTINPTYFSFYIIL